MQVLKRAPRNDRPTLRPSAPDPKAMVERAAYLVGRYGAPADQVEAIVAGMDRPTQTLLAIEMAERQREAYTADYDPFGAI